MEEGRQRLERRLAFAGRVDERHPTVVVPREPNPVQRLPFAAERIDERHPPGGPTEEVALQEAEARPSDWPLRRNPFPF